LTFRTILVHNMFCRCCELLKKIYLYNDIKYLNESDFKFAYSLTVKIINSISNIFFFNFRCAVYSTS
jgi:hypothetical protein